MFSFNWLWLFRDINLALVCTEKEKHFLGHAVSPPRFKRDTLRQKS
jgi:hypothetical protein